MGDFLRKCISRQFLALRDGDIAALQGGAETLAVFHQPTFDEWITGSIAGPLPRIKVDETNCSGMIEWAAVRASTAHLLPKHTAVGWKHPNSRLSNRKESNLCPKTEVLSRSDVGLFECSLALGTIAVEARLSMAKQPFQGRLPWVGAGDAEQLRTNLLARRERLQTCSWGGPENRRRGRPQTPSGSAEASQRIPVRNWLQGDHRRHPCRALGGDGGTAKSSNNDT